VQEDAHALLVAAAHSQTLRVLDIRGAPLSQRSLESAKQLLMHSAALRSLRVTVDTAAAAEALHAAATAARGGQQVEVHAAIAAQHGAAGGTRLHPAGGLTDRVAATGPAPSAPDLGGALQAQERERRMHELQRTEAIQAFHNAADHSGIGSRRASTCGSNGSRGAARKQPFPCVANGTPSLKPRVSTLPAKLPGRAHTQGISAGGAAERAAAVFLRADTEGRGVISSDKVAAALHELGLLTDLPPSQVRSG
jgi:hypothetical protein